MVVENASMRGSMLSFSNTCDDISVYPEPGCRWSFAHTMLSVFIFRTIVYSVMTSLVICQPRLIALVL